MALLETRAVPSSGARGDTAVEWSDRVGFGQNKSIIKIFHIDSSSHSFTLLRSPPPFSFLIHHDDVSYISSTPPSSLPYDTRRVDSTGSYGLKKDSIGCFSFTLVPIISVSQGFNDICTSQVPESVHSKISTWGLEL
jgi:hypothetical protein